jgi:hypothetical protein
MPTGAPQVLVLVLLLHTVQRTLVRSPWPALASRQTPDCCQVPALTPVTLLRHGLNRCLAGWNGCFRAAAAAAFSP